MMGFAIYDNHKNDIIIDTSCHKNLLPLLPGKPNCMLERQTGYPAIVYS